MSKRIKKEDRLWFNPYYVARIFGWKFVKDILTKIKNEGAKK